MNFKKVNVIGLGYIGLPTAAMFAHHDVEVCGVDINQQTVETINGGGIHIVEPGLADVVKQAVAEKKLVAETKPSRADAFLIAVPTPFKNENEPDLSYIESASNSIAPVLESGNLVVLESTSPVGTTEKVADWLARARPDLTFPQTHGEKSDVRIAYCPERVLPGKIMQELVTNDRVIGGITKKCSLVASELYKTFVKSECIVTNARTAEMCKLTENSFRDVNIAFANELSVVCDKLDINVWELVSLANRHPRVNILQPGPGVGGHCIAVDPWFIVSSAKEEARLIRTAREVNDSKPDWVIEKIQIKIAEFLQANRNKTIQDVTVACYGLTFKPDIDDLRESPALEITKRLVEMGLNVLAVEPNIEALPKSSENIFSLCEMPKAKAVADIHVVLVLHSRFKEIEFNQEDLMLCFCGEIGDGA